MQKLIFRLAAALYLFLLVNTGLVADPFPGSGNLEKINWSMQKDAVVANIPQSVLKDAVITNEKVSYSDYDFTKAMISDSFEFLFIKEGALYEVQISKMFNLEIADGAKIFQDFVNTTVDQYTQKLGKPDVDDAKTFDAKDSKLLFGTMAWQANPKRVAFPDLQIEISILASGTLVFFTETCTNTPAKPK